jgi:short-subunit dehydrogenase
LAEKETPKTAVVTGGSSGIGLELAKCFARDGNKVIIVAEDQHKLNKAAAELRVEGAAEVETLSIDLSKDDGAPKLYEEMKKRETTPDFLALNAGVGVWGDFAHETDLADELRMIHLNVISPVQAAKLFGRDMAERGSGRILFTSSISALGPVPKLAVYSGTKAFLHVFAEALHNELQETGVTVTAILADATETDFFNRAGAGESQTARAKKADPSVIADAGYRALLKGSDHVVTPKMAKLKAAVASVVPEQFTARQARAE